MLFIVRKMVYILSDTKSESFNFTPHRYVCYNFPMIARFNFVPLAFDLVGHYSPVQPKIWLC